MSEAVLAMSMSLADLEKVQALYPDHKIELREGKIIPQKTTLGDGETLSIPDLFPGLEIPITNLWPPVKKK